MIEYEIIINRDYTKFITFIKRKANILQIKLTQKNKNKLKLFAKLF